MDNFVLEAVSLKQLRKIRVGHDGTGALIFTRCSILQRSSPCLGAGAGWFLDKVVVRPEDPRYEAATFECSRYAPREREDRFIADLLDGWLPTKTTDKSFES